MKIYAKLPSFYLFSFRRRYEKHRKHRKRKKKKKKTTFDLDAALAQAGTDEPVPDTNEKENQEPVEADADGN